MKLTLLLLLWQYLPELFIAYAQRMENRILTIAIALLSLSCSSPKPTTFQARVADTSLTYATVIEYKFKNGKRSNEGLEVARYGFDKRKNLVENYDKKGLFLKYSFDSLNNVYEEFFYEKYDSITGLRILSSKWTHDYANGLIMKTYRYYMRGSQLALDHTVRYEYVFNSNGQIIENKMFDNSDHLKGVVKTEYLKDAKHEQYPFDFNRIGTLTRHFCTKEVTYSAEGQIKDSTRYLFDKEARISKKLMYNPQHKYATVITYKYNEENQVVEQSQYFGDNGDLFYTKKFEYHANGLLVKETWFNSSNIPEWTREFRY